jgi:hypothetical protein
MDWEERVVNDPADGTSPYPGKLVTPDVQTTFSLVGWAVRVIS